MQYESYPDQVRKQTKPKLLYLIRYFFEGNWPRVFIKLLGRYRFEFVGAAHLKARYRYLHINDHPWE